jgi:putative phosphoesterase
VKIAVISDTHLPRFAARLDAGLCHVAAERPQLILHCGDWTSLDAVAEFEAIAPVEAVAGNNDGPELVRRFGRRKIVDVEGRRIGIVHGDGSRGTTLDRACAAFAGESLDAIVFGHSHAAYAERRGDVWIVNPGSLTDKRRAPQCSFAVLESDAPSGLTARLVYFDSDAQPSIGSSRRSPAARANT